MKSQLSLCSIGVRALLAGTGLMTAAPASEPPNLALQAKAAASSEFSTDYAASFAVDGNIAAANSSADARQAWCVNGPAAAGHADFTLEWPQPVTVAEMVYWARTAWLPTDCWQDYQVFLDEATLPAVAGKLLQVDGPQRIPLPAPARVRRVTLKFTSSHGGPNPGAAEIAVYGARPSDTLLTNFPPSPLHTSLISGQLGFTDILVIKRHHLTTSHVYTYHVDGFIPGGGLEVYSPATATMRELVAAGSGEILDCDLSYDGKEVLFSWKQNGPPIRDVASSGTEHSLATPTDNYQIFRVNLDGSALTQLTRDPSNNLSPRWLPDGGIVFTSDRRAAFAYCWVSSSPVLYRMERDGSRVLKISSSYLMDFTPCVLNDGRILYTRWEYVDRPAIPIQGLWTIRPDGTGLAGYFGNRVLEPATFMQAQAIPGTGKVICMLTSHGGDPRGAIAIIDPNHGSNAQQSIQNLTPELDIGRVDQGNGESLRNRGPYEAPFPIDQQHYLVSRAGAIQLRDFNHANAPATVLAKPTDGMGYYSPVPIQPRPMPMTMPVPNIPADTPPWATIYMSDVYNGLEPVVQRGEVKQLVIVEELAKTTFAPVQSRAFGFQFPLVSCGATYTPKRIWGYADVAPDGSAYFKAPANRPIYFLALDAHGRAVQRMRTFTHFMPGEKQSCIGCHANRNESIASSKRPMNGQVPQELRPPAWGVKGFGYREVVQPVLDRHCVECHNARDETNNIDLGGDMTDFFNVSYETLARAGTWGERQFMEGGIAAENAGRNPYTNWIPTINGTEHSILMITPKTWGSPASKLADLVISGHPDATGKPRVRMDAESQQRIMAWIDINVPYYPTSSSNNLEAVGCRRIYPDQLNPTLEKVAATRCLSCHAQGVPREFYLRIEKPELNKFMLAPLAKAAGGTGKCATAVFASTADPDYQALLKTFQPVAEQLRRAPREDMPGARLNEESCSAPTPGP